MTNMSTCTCGRVHKASKHVAKQVNAISYDEGIKVCLWHKIPHSILTHFVTVATISVRALKRSLGELPTDDPRFHSKAGYFSIISCIIVLAIYIW